MAATARNSGRNTGRRALLLSFIGLPMLGDTRDEVYRVLADMATDLANGLGRAFVKNFAQDMPGFAEIAKDVEGLLAAADVSASVELREVSEANGRVTAQVDWYLQLKSKREVAGVQQRREILKMEFAKVGKHWRVVEMTPANFFRPA